MGRTRIAKAIINDLKEKKDASQKRRDEIIDYLKRLNQAHLNQKISGAQYVETLHKKIDGRNIKEWVNYYENYSQNCEREIESQKKKIIKSKIPIFFFSIVLISIFILVLLNMNFNFTGFGIKTQGQEFSQNLNLNLTENASYEWQLENIGQLNYVKISGLIEGEGNVKIYLDDLLIMDSSKIKNERAMLTGGVIEEATGEGTIVEENPIVGPIEQTEQTQNTPSEIQTPDTSISNSEVINESGALPKEESSPSQEEPQPSESNITEIQNETTTEIQNNTIPTESQNETLTLIKKFIDVCIETCDLNGLNLTKSSYTLRIEIENSKLELNTITYNIIQEEILPEEIIPEGNITLENSTVNTTQYQAILGQPVKWKKEISLNESGSVIVELPKEAENIVVNKIIESNSDKEAPSQEESSPSQGELLTEKANANIKTKIKSDEEIQQSSKITGNAVSTTGKTQTNEKEIIQVSINDNATNYEIEYETPAPYAVEENLTNGKKIKIVGPETIHYENVLTFTNLDENLNIKRPSQIKIHWIEEDVYISPTKIQDKDNNGIYDYVEWTVPHLSNQTFELEITILNVHSHPSLYGNWTVEFETTGTANLTITATLDKNYTTEITRWSNESEDNSLYDLKFLEIKCGNETKKYEWEGTNCDKQECSVFIPNYSCNETAKEISRVLTPKKHVLKFNFGGIEAYAYNDVGAVIKNVQSGSTSLANTVASIDITISAVNLSSSFLIFSNTLNDIRPDDQDLRGNFTNSTNIHFERGATAGAVKIVWYAAEFESGVYVQSGTATLNAATMNIPLTSPINLSRSFPIGTFENDASGTWANDDEMRFQFITNSTNFEAYCPGITADKFSWQAIDYPGAKIQNGSFTLTTNSTDVNINAVDLSKSFVITSLAATTTTALLARSEGLLANFTNSTRLHFERKMSVGTVAVAWYVVEFTGAETVQTGNTYFNQKTLSTNVTINSVNTSRAIAFLSGNQKSGEGNESTQNVGTLWFTANLTNSTNLNLTRATLGTTSYAAAQWFVVEFAGSTVDSTPPTYTQVSTNNTAAGISTNFSINVNDDSALNPNGGYIFSTNNTGEWINDTLVNFTTTPSWANVTKTLDAVSGHMVGYRWYFNDSYSTPNTNSTPIYVVTTTDGTDPYFSTIPANSSFFYGNQSLNVTFVATDETGFSMYFINDTRFSIMNSTGWLTNATPMAVGNYEINVTINDTSNNINWTRYTVHIDKSNYYDCEVYFNVGTPQTYPNNFTVFTNCSSAYQIYQNQSPIANYSNVSGGVGYYNLTVIRTDTANYTNIFDDEFFTINKNPNDKCQVLYNATSGIYYPDTYLAWTNCTTAVTFKRNTTVISNNSVQNSGWGAYNFSFLRTDTQNYSYIYNESQFIVAKNTANICGVYFNSTSGITYPTNFSVFTNCSGNITSPGWTLYRNGTSINNNTFVKAGAGYYNLTVIRTDTANYTSTVDSQFFTVSKNPNDKCQVLYNATSGINYPDTFLVWANCTSAFVLARNGTTINNNTEQALAASAYNFSFLRTDNINYSYLYNETQFRISKATGEVYAYLNSSFRSNATIEQNQAEYLNATLNIGEGDITLYYDNSKINEGASPLSNLTTFSTIGVFNVTSFYNGNQNYTSDYETWWMNVTAPSNVPPQIYAVTSIPAVTLTDGPSPTFVIVNFSVYDANGASNLNNASAAVNFTKATEDLRYNSSCAVKDYSGNYANYTCNVTMWWWDAAGSDWKVYANISDLDTNLAVNDTTTFTVNPIKGFVMTPSALTFSGLSAGATNQTPTNYFILNNTGNVDIGIGNVQINATDLVGETDHSTFLWAGNFSASPYTGGNIECNITTSATAMVNMSYTGISNTILSAGNFTKNDGTTGQEQVYLCLRQVGSELTTQPYSTAGFGSWIVKIALVLVSVRRKKKKNSKNLINIIFPLTIFSSKLGALEAISKYMKENLGMNYNEIAELLNRDERTIWTSYNKSLKKQKEHIQVKENTLFLPICVLNNRKLTILESVVLYLKEKEMKYSEIAKLLNRDERNIWTIYSRVSNSLNKKEIENLTDIKVELNIPITIFSNRLGALELISKYMKENMGLSYHRIAELLNRDERTIWTAYNKSLTKQKEIIIAKETNISLPISIFVNRNFTPLESIIIYLKSKDMKYAEIAELLKRDERNIRATYNKNKE